MRRMVSLSDHQLEIVTTAASAVPVERRSVFLERRGAMLRMRWQISAIYVEVPADSRKNRTAGRAFKIL